MQLLSLHIRCSGRTLPHSFAAYDRESSSSEQIKMLMRNMAEMLRMVVWLMDTAHNDSSNEDGYRHDVR